MVRLRDPHDLDSPANAAAPTAAPAGKSARTDDLPVQRKAAGSAPPELGFAPPRAPADDPFGLHVAGAAGGGVVQRQQATTTTKGTSVNGAEERERVAETVKFMTRAIER